jgi:hypothetical protein
MRIGLLAILALTAVPFMALPASAQSGSMTGSDRVTTMSPPSSAASSATPEQAAVPPGQNASRVSGAEGTIGPRVGSDRVGR